ncbi:hypothetical protein SEA_YABOI_214 [Streptomyces phage Yaboi]|jgi:hypothetical protein|uniref:Uncharacterized protein n=3 Tax=Streptomyces virus Yaboi TaxID=2846408 RepID=A0A385UH94_9CAUD|nr:hypothetical protein HWB86_gp108 [Streptomyces phage Yaboi]QAY08834.1 hypothetical protein SEA_GENIE2_208 [Streptomyces phage Genie2]QAY12824.1 hypothetical protein SEA_BOOMERJR_208 [Streptomyces phage BoomerJR]UVD40019.1 hypothetical protein SEA_STANIMAL_209 [Streptomyces phage Stanimal]WNM73761.1 hypothetical protein SEA_SOLLERTIA_210 [Streptomyces phage Sollertia]AYB71011.1 hypothetical protein SEA_YABOI_214 [Streptomyces phage Yaboi]
MGFMDFLTGVGNPLSATSRAGRKLEVEALRWACNRVKLHTPYYVRSEIHPRHKATYADTNPDGYVYFEYIFVKKTRIHKIPVTAHGTRANQIYYYYNGEISEKRPKNYLTNKQLKALESRIMRECSEGFTFD